MARNSVKDWNNLHYALAVARAGTLSGAALELNVSHSTVLRRIDALEKALDTRLFIRHPRGYVPTEAGQMLMNAAENMQDQLDLMVGKMQGVDEALHGTLVITTVNTLYSATDADHPRISGAESSGSIAAGGRSQAPAPGTWGGAYRYSPGGETDGA